MRPDTTHAERSARWGQDAAAGMFSRLAEARGVRQQIRPVLIETPRAPFAEQNRPPLDRRRLQRMDEENEPGRGPMDDFMARPDFPGDGQREFLAFTLFRTLMRSRVPKESPWGRE